jgi:hypothetical protein
MLRANNILQIGGVDEDVEADEVSFRCEPYMDGDTKMRRWIRFLGVVRRGSSLYYWAELNDRETEAAQGGGGPIADQEVEEHMLGRSSGRALLAPWSVLHTDGAKAYQKLHRSSGNPIFKHLHLWHTFVRHSRKKGPDGKMMPVQFVIRKRVKLKSGGWEWRKGGTQKKDGFWRLVRRHVSRRGVTTTQRDSIRHMGRFFQWLYWKSEDPMRDAMNGRHLGPPCSDMLSALGRLRLQVREALGDDVLAMHGTKWFEELSDHALDDLPVARKRVREKGPQP